MSTTLEFCEGVTIEFVEPKRCALCTHWKPWRSFSQQSVGHCVITHETPDGGEMVAAIQGLTGWDFCCTRYRRNELFQVPGDENL